MLFLASLSVFVITVLQLFGPSDGGRSQKLVCYAELWSADRPSPDRYNLDTLPPKTCNYLILMYMTLDASTWTLKFDTGYGTVDPDDLTKAVQARSASPQMKILIAVGGWEDGVAKYSDMISEPSRRQAFIKSVVEVLDAYDLDGLELHWLYPGVVWRKGRSGDKENFVQLVRELKVAFKPNRWILTASVPPDEATLLGGYNVPRLNSLLDQMHLRTLDMRGDWLHTASGHCPLYSNPWEKSDLRNLNVNESVALWLRQGASSRKLIPTFPFYGRSFTLMDPSKTAPGAPTIGPGKATPSINAAGIMAYFEICDSLQNNKLARKFQRGAEMPYAVDDDFWVGYDDEESLQKKVKLVSDKLLGGAAVFAVSLDDFGGKCGQSNFLLNKVRGYLDDEGSSPFAVDPRGRFSG